MIRRTETSDTANERAALVEALRSGVKAMADSEIESRVVDYFLKNPNYSRDAVHVAAVACRFQTEKESLPAQSIRANSVSPKL